jgi:hypothetical protein
MREVELAGGMEVFEVTNQKLPKMEKSFQFLTNIRGQ